MHRIQDDIKQNNFAPAYLLYGGESYLRRAYRQLLVRALVAEGDELNYTVFEGSKCDATAIAELADTLPFLAEKRVILVIGSGFFSKNADVLATYLKNPSDSTVVIFDEESIDKRNACYKAVNGLERDIEMVADETLINTWVLQRLKKNNKSMQNSVLRDFIDSTDSSMENMERELEKLISYVGDRSVITIEDVRTICFRQIETKIFDMIDAIAYRNMKNAMKHYHDMLSAREDPMKIMGTLTSQFRQLLGIKELMSYGHSPKVIAEKLGLKDWQVKKKIPLAKNFTMADLQRMLTTAADYDFKVKNGLIKDTLAVELLIYDFVM